MTTDIDKAWEISGELNLNGEGLLKFTHTGQNRIEIHLYSLPAISGEAIDYHTNYSTSISDSKIPVDAKSSYQYGKGADAPRSYGDQGPLLQVFSHANNFWHLDANYLPEDIDQSAIAQQLMISIQNTFL